MGWCDSAQSEAGGSDFIVEVYWFDSHKNRIKKKEVRIKLTKYKFSHHLFLSLITKTSSPSQHQTPCPEDVPILCLYHYNCINYIVSIVGLLDPTLP